MFYHVRGIFENPVGENHYTKANLVTHNNFERALQNQAAAGAGKQALILAQLERPAIREPKINFQDVIDQRSVKQLGHTELSDIAQTRNVVPLGRLDGDYLKFRILAAQKSARSGDRAARA